MTEEYKEENVVEVICVYSGTSRFTEGNKYVGSILNDELKLLDEEGDQACYPLKGGIWGFKIVNMFTKPNDEDYSILNTLLNKLQIA